MGKAERMQVAILRDFQWGESGGVHFVRGAVQVDAPIVFQPQFELATALDDPPIASSPEHDAAWLPRGVYAVTAPVPDVLAERGRLMVRMSHRASFETRIEAAAEVVRSRGSAASGHAPGWSISAIAPTADLSA